MVKSGVEAAVFVQCLNRLELSLFPLCCNCLSLYNVPTGQNSIGFHMGKFASLEMIISLIETGDQLFLMPLYLHNLSFSFVLSLLEIELQKHPHQRNEEINLIEIKIPAAPKSLPGWLHWPKSTSLSKE